MYHDVIREVCKKYGKTYTKELQSQMIGGTDRAISEYVVKELKINESVDKFERYLLKVSAERLPHAPLQKGVERLLKHLLLHQVPMALATNSTAQQVQLHAKTKPEIFGVFHHATTATDIDVGRAKPFPDLFLLAASKFDEKPAPEKCLVFEDSMVGLRAGVAAGMQVVLTPHTRQLNPEQVQDAAVVLDSLLQFKPELFGLPPFDDHPKKSPWQSNTCVMSYSKQSPPNMPVDHTKICHGCGCRKNEKPTLESSPPPCPVHESPPPPCPPPPYPAYPCPRPPCPAYPCPPPPSPSYQSPPPTFQKPPQPSPTDESREPPCRATIRGPPPPCQTPCYPPKPSPCVPPTLKPSSSICKPKGRPPWHSLVMFMLLCGITCATLERLW